jgi:hypothetical protein
MTTAGLTNDQVRAYLAVPPGEAVQTALDAIERSESCQRCQGTRVEILRVPDMSARYGFRQYARRCDHKVEEVSDGKASAAGKDE